MRDNIILRLVSGLSIIVTLYLGIVAFISTVISYIFVQHYGGTTLFEGMTEQSHIWLIVYDISFWITLVCLVVFLISSLYIYIYVPFEDYPYPENLMEWVALIAINIGYKTIFVLAYMIIFSAYVIWSPFSIFFSFIIRQFNKKGV